MGAKETILQAVASNKPDLTELPDIDFSLTTRYPDLIDQFTRMVEAAGGTPFYHNSWQVFQDDISAVRARNSFFINLVEKSDAEKWTGLKASELKALDTCYIRAQLAVAENGAMWLSEKQMGNRLLPFICQHLVITLNPHNIVHNMHEAYEQINAGSEGYGVFIAGPSKTADIEQNLVIGAHGARSLRVYLIDNQ